MPVGIKDIAAELNLGLSTVAQALRGTGTISSRTRRLVVEHAQKRGYTPNRNAQRMRRGRTGVIGLIVPDVVLSPYVEVVQHLFQIVENQGRELQIALTEFYETLEDRAFKSMLASRVDGIIAKVGFARWEDVPEEHYLRRAKEEGVPVVLYSNPINGSELPYMRHPMEPSVRQIVRHLLSMGHRRFAAMVPAAKPFGEMMQRWVATIREELSAAGDTFALETVGLKDSDVNAEGPRGTFRSYVNQNHPKYAVPAGRLLFRQAHAVAIAPTAYIAYSDPAAIGAIFEAQAMNLRIGHEVAIAGCGQMPSSFCSPISLTTIDRRPAQYAQKLMSLLDAYVDPKNDVEPPTLGEIDPLLVVGESTVGA